ncbi:MAG: hypothetical protein IPG12_17100 [Saprospiraceae bacterium]|nr:hypothetical protein [Saprospiraceae bacterium]
MIYKNCTLGILNLKEEIISIFSLKPGLKKWFTTAIFSTSVIFGFTCSQVKYTSPQELILYKNSVIESGRSDLCLIYSNPPLKYNDYVLPTFSLSRIFQ